MADDNLQFINKVPPHDDNAEQAVIGSMIFDQEGITGAYEILTENDFYNPIHKDIFSAIIQLFIENKPVDLITLTSQLEKNGTLEKIGGIQTLADLLSTVSTSANIKQYAAIVAEKSLLRRLIKTTGEVSDLSYEGKENADDILSYAEERIFNLSENKKTQDFVHIKEAANDVLKQVEDIIENGASQGIKSGFVDLDRKTSGFHNSELILIAARPGMGKTAFALNIACNVAIKQNIPVAIFSLEMSKEQLASRLLCINGKIDSEKLKTGDLSDDDLYKLGSSLEELEKAPIYLDDTAAITPTSIRSKCRKLKLEKGLGMIIIDYLQLMGSGVKGESRQNVVAEISRSLKLIAKELNVPIIALSQLSRAVEQRKSDDNSKRPVLSDLRESGSIEQDADIVMFIYRDEYYRKEESNKPGIAEIIVEKQRNGPTGTIELLWIGKYTKFENKEFD